MITSHLKSYAKVSSKWVKKFDVMLQFRNHIQENMAPPSWILPKVMSSNSTPLVKKWILDSNKDTLQNGRIFSHHPFNKELITKIYKALNSIQQNHKTKHPCQKEEK